MLDILEYLTTELRKICPRTYNNNANEDAIFPYVVFNLPTTTVPESDSELVVLEINIWDYSRDSYDATINAEILTDRIEDFLKFNRELGDDHLMIFTKINRLTLNDPDPNIRRKQLRYTIKYYDK